MSIGKRLCKIRDKIRDKITGRASLCHGASCTLALLIAPLMAPQFALAENASEDTGLASDISEVFGSQKTAQTTHNPNQADAQNNTAQETQGGSDTAATATDASAASITSTSEPPKAHNTPTSNTPTGSARSQSAAPATAAGVNGGDVAVHIEGSSQSAASAKQGHMENPAATLGTTPAQTGKSGQTENGGQAAKLKQADNTRAAAQVWDARTGIVTPGTAGRLVHVFGASIPTLVCQPGMVCLMELEAGEEVLDTPVQADPARWRVELRHRDTPVSQTYFAFKPSEDAAPRTNFVVLTDRRVYVVKDLLHSTYILSFDYPDTRAAKLAAEIKTRTDARATAKAAKSRRRKQAIARSGVSTTRGAVPASDLDFNYSIQGTAPFKPLRVYNDGRKTYVDLPARYRGDLPVVIGGAAQDNKAFNYRTGRDGTQFIIDRVLRDFILQDGRKRIRIRRGS